MTDTERLDWIDEPLVLPKVMGFWLQTGVSSIREAIDSFAKATDKEDEEDKGRPLEF